jgi:hypothetical protein
MGSTRANASNFSGGFPTIGSMSGGILRPFNFADKADAAQSLGSATSVMRMCAHDIMLSCSTDHDLLRSNWPKPNKRERYSWPKLLLSEEGKLHFHDGADMTSALSNVRKADISDPEAAVCHDIGGQDLI